MDDYRCLTCDARYCGLVCHSATPGYVYVAGRGWKNASTALVLEAKGYRVDWPVNA